MPLTDFLLKTTPTKETVLHKTITYYVDVLQDLSWLPPHVLRVCDAVLDDSFTVLARFESEIRVIKPDPFCDETCQLKCSDITHKDWYSLLDWEKALSTARISDEEYKDVHKTRRWAEETYMKARKFMRLRQKEKAWDDFYYKQFFEKLQEDNMPQNWHSSREARSRFYYDSFEIDKDSSWTTFQKDRDCDKVPKPDLVAHFKIHDENDESTASARDRWQWDSKPNPSITKSFSRSTLLHLQKKGLVASTFKRFGEEHKMKKNEHGEYVLGYPWLVAEYKRTQENKNERCYEQAANAARCVLHMYSNLAKYCRGDSATPVEHDPCIPPLITMTGVESDVRIWIAWSQHEYREDDPRRESVQMRCIWQGDMRISKDVLKLQSILENTHTWAMRDLRGTISTYLDLWLTRFPPDPPTPTTLKKQYHKAQSEPPSTPKSVGKQAVDFFQDLPQTPQEYEDRVMELFTRAFGSLGLKTPISETKHFGSAQTYELATAPQQRAYRSADGINDSPSVLVNGTKVQIASRSSPQLGQSQKRPPLEKANHQTLSHTTAGTYPCSDSNGEDESDHHDAAGQDVDSSDNDNGLLQPSTPSRKPRSRASSTGSRRSFRLSSQEPEYHGLPKETRI